MNKTAPARKASGRLNPSHIPAYENPTWGIDRIVGALSNLGGRLNDYYRKAA